MDELQTLIDKWDLILSTFKEELLKHGLNPSKYISLMVMF